MSGRINATDILWSAVVISVMVAGVVLLYRGMQRPRLKLTHTTEGWRATRRDVLLYLASILPLIVIWWTVLAVILLLSSSEMTPLRMVTVCGGVIIAVRIMAHVWEEPAHELSKTIPLTLLTLIMISGTLRDPATFPDLWDEMFNVDVPWHSFVLLVAVDLLITAGWYWGGVRLLIPCGFRLPGVPGPTGDATRVPTLQE